MLFQRQRFLILGLCLLKADQAHFACGNTSNIIPGGFYLGTLPNVVPWEYFKKIEDPFKSYAGKQV